MGTIHTTTNANAVRHPGQRRIDRQTATGHLFYIAWSGNTYTVYRSTDNGTSWAAFGAVRNTSDGLNIQEMGGLHVDWKNRLYFAYRTSDGSNDKVYMQAGVITTSNVSWHSPLLVASGSNGGIAGNYLSGMTPGVVRHNDGRSTGFVAVGWSNGLSLGVACYGFTIPAVGQPTLNLGVVSGKRSWSFLQGGTRHQVPATTYEYSPAHMWVVWGRTYLHAVKMTWNGSGWTGPSTAIRLSYYGSGTPAPPAVESVAAIWRNPGLLVAQPYQYDTTSVVVFERNQANTWTTPYITPVHPAGVVRHCSIAWNNVSRDFRVYAVGTSDNLLYYADYIQASGTWSGWSSVSATAVAGTNAENYNVRRESYQSAKYDVLYENGGGSPWNVTHVSQTLTYAPYAPFWRFASTTNSMEANGTAWHIERDLDLVWVFSDPDTNDAQTAWALSRQIGAGTIEYYRSSDGTWQATEQKNISGTSSHTLPGFTWGLDSDDNHTYKVKVWDSSDTASVYSTALTVIPSQKVNPTITVPASDGFVVTTETLTIEWDVLEQTAYRVKVQIFDDVLYDSGWRSGTTTRRFTVPYILNDGWNYTFRVWTRNNEGLESDYGQRTILCDIFQPPVPTVTTTALSDQGVIRVEISNPLPAALNSNTDFEVDTAGWHGVGEASFTHSTAQAHGGSGSARVVPDGVATSCYAETSAAETGAPGDTFTVWGWIRPDTDNGKQCTVLLHWLNSGAYVTSTVADFDPTPGEWQELVLQGTMPGGCNEVVAGIGRRDTPAAGDAFYVDDVRVMAGAQPKVLYNYLNRRKYFSVFDNTTLVQVATEIDVDGTYDDWTVRSGYGYEYQAVAVADNGTSIGSGYVG